MLKRTEAATPLLKYESGSTVLLNSTGRSSLICVLVFPLTVGLPHIVLFMGLCQKPCNDSLRVMMICLYLTPATGVRKEPDRPPPPHRTTKESSSRAQDLVSQHQDTTPFRNRKEGLSLPRTFLRSHIPTNLTTEGQS